MKIRSGWMILLGLVTLLGSGCAYHREFSAGEQALAAGDYRAAIVAFEAAQAQPQVRQGDDLPGKLAAARAGLGGQLAQEAEQAAAASPPQWGRAWALAARAASLDAKFKPLLSSIAERIRTQQALKVHVQPRDTVAARAWNALTSDVTARADIQMVEDPAAADLQVEYFIGAVMPERSTTMKRKVIQYEKRRITEPNPAYATQQAKIASTRNRAKEARRAADFERDGYVQTNILSERDNSNTNYSDQTTIMARQRWDDAQRRLRAAEADVQRELKLLESIKQTREVPEFEPYEFEFKLHQQSAVAPLGGTLTPKGGEPQPLDARLSVAWAFEEYPAQPVAKLPASIPELRTDEELGYELAQQAGSHVAAAILAEADRRAAALLAVAHDETADDDARATAFAALLAGGRTLTVPEQSAAVGVFGRLAGK